MQDQIKLQIHIKSGSNVQQFYHVLAEDMPANASSLQTGTSKGLKWTAFPPCRQIPGSSPLAGISYTSSCISVFTSIFSLCTLFVFFTSLLLVLHPITKTQKQLIGLFCYCLKTRKSTSSKPAESIKQTSIQQWMHTSHIWCPKCEVVLQQLHDKSVIFVRFFPHCVKLRNSLIKCL